MKPSRELGLSSHAAFCHEYDTPFGRLPHVARLNVAYNNPEIDPEGAARRRADACRRLAEEDAENGEEGGLLDCDWSVVTRRRKTR